MRIFSTVSLHGILSAREILRNSCDKLANEWSEPSEETVRLSSIELDPSTSLSKEGGSGTLSFPSSMGVFLLTDELVEDSSMAEMVCFRLGASDEDF